MYTEYSKKHIGGSVRVNIIVQWDLSIALRCFLCLLLNYIHDIIDKRGVLSHEYYQPPITPLTSGE